MIFGFVLLCSVALTGPDCQPNTAKQVIRVLDDTEQFAYFDQPMACLRDSMTWAALHVTVPTGMWAKFTCEHSHPANHG